MKKWIGGVLLILLTCTASESDLVAGWVAGQASWSNGILTKENGVVYICVGTPNCPGGETGRPSVRPDIWRPVSGIDAWQAGTPYPQDRLIMRAGRTYVSIQAVPPNKNPIHSPTYWQEQFTTGSPMVFATTGDDIQAAINVAGPGGIVQLACGNYSLPGTISINKALTLQGCGPGGMQFPGNIGTRLIGNACCDNLTINTASGVTIRDLVLEIAPNKAGLKITTPGAVPNEGNINDRSIIERVWFRDGGYGILTDPGRVRATLISHSYFNSQTVAGVYFQGVSHTVCNINGEPYPSCSTGTHVDNCDGGGYTLTDNLFEGDKNTGPNSDAMFFVNSAAVTLKGNQVIAWGRDAVSFIQSCYTPGPAPTQFQFVGNEFEAGVGRNAIRVIGQHGSFFIGSNYLSGSSRPAVEMTSTTDKTIYDVQLTGNQLRIFGFPSSTQAGLLLDHVSAVLIIGNNFLVGQNGTAPNGAILTNIEMLTMVGNTMGIGGLVTNGYSVSCKSGTSCFCGVANIANVTGSKYPIVLPLVGC